MTGNCNFSLAGKCDRCGEELLFDPPSAPEEDMGSAGYMQFAIKELDKYLRSVGWKVNDTDHSSICPKCINN